MDQNYVPVPQARALAVALKICVEVSRRLQKSSAVCSMTPMSTAALAARASMDLTHRLRQQHRGDHQSHTLIKF